MILPAANSKDSQISSIRPTPTLVSIDGTIWWTINRLRVLESTYATPSLSNDLKKGRYFSAFDIAKNSIANDAHATMSLLWELYSYLHQIEERKDIIAAQPNRKSWLLSKAMSRVLTLLRRKDQSSRVIEQIEEYIVENMIKSLRVLEALERELETHSKNPSTPIPVSIWEIAQDKSIKDIKEGVIPGEKKYAIWRGIILRYLQLHQLLAVHFPDFKGGSWSHSQWTFIYCKQRLQNIATWENAPSTDFPNASAVERTNEILQKMLAQPSEEGWAAYDHVPHITSPENLSQAVTQTKEGIHIVKIANILVMSPGQKKRIQEMLAYWRIHS